MVRHESEPVVEAKFDPSVVSERTVDDSEFDKVVNEVADRDDPDDFDEELGKDFTFVDGEIAPDLASKMQSIEHIREYLEQELGEETLMQAYPVLRDFGDDILFEEKTP